MVEVDTSYFLGNSPGAAHGHRNRVRTERKWSCCRAPTCCPTPGTGSCVGPGPAVQTVRLDIYPDGGLARLRVWGELA